jgi:menaquinone-dependent protoporphyrinogen oxidase
MRVLVAYASRYGSTKGIADFIGDRLREKGMDAYVLDVKQVQDLATYDAFVLGSALFMGHWMKEARQFVSRNREALTGRPVWLFSSGPTGTEKKDKRGRDLLDPSVSGPTELRELEERLEVRDHRVFFGAFGDGSGFWARFVPKSEKGDFRDWQSIEAWSDDIASSLAA